MSDRTARRNCLADSPQCKMWPHAQAAPRRLSPFSFHYYFALLERFSRADTPVYSTECPLTRLTADRPGPAPAALTGTTPNIESRNKFQSPNVRNEPTDPAGLFRAFDFEILSLFRISGFELRILFITLPFCAGAGAWPRALCRWPSSRLRLAPNFSVKLKPNR